MHDIGRYECICIRNQLVSSGETTQSGWDGVTTEKIYELTNCQVTFSLSSYWEGGYNADVKIQNTSKQAIENWYLCCDLDNKISNIWNAEINSHENGVYVIKNAGWNQDIAVGQKVEFGFSANENFSGFPSVFQMLGTSSSADEKAYAVEYHIDSDWGNGFTGTIEITNNSNVTIEDWTLAFDFDRTISSIWDGAVESHEGNHYVIKNAGYNSNIQPGETVSFGFTGSNGEKTDEPYEYELSSYTLETEIDTTTDTDNDKVADYVEDYFGTSKVKEDTDGDGLSNIKEAEIGTKLLNPDTDKDGLTDGDEEKIYGTSPLLYDTDGDGASDGKEVELGFNPLEKETEFEVCLNAKEEDTVNVSVTVELSGEQVDSLQVERFENEFLFPETMPGYIGGAYDFSVDGSFESATLQFEFDESLLEDKTFDPVIYYFNEETQLLEELETTVNGNMASAKVEHFSKYILLNRTVFANAFIWKDVWTSNGYEGVEIVLVIDDSGSMTYNDRTRQRLTVAQNLIDKLPENNKIGIVKFTDSTTMLTSVLTDDKEKAKSYLSTNYFKSSGGTSMYTAISSAFSLFQSNDDTVLKMMVVLSDGETSGTGYHSSVITTAKNNDVKIYTVGLGTSSSGYFTNYLKPLANETGGAFYLASDASKLEEIYNDISDKIDIETDSDGDGIADYYEENMVRFNGMTMKLDKNNPDSDNDGLSDGEEVVELNYQYNEDKTKVIVTGRLKSNPIEKDTDGDGLTDEEEVYYYGTSPLSRDTDGDGLSDKLEIDEWFDPLKKDADRDGRPDRIEYEEGTSPYEYDKEWNEYLWDFVCGFILGAIQGDFIRETDSVPVMLGQIVGSFIPWVDVRDVIANLAYKDYLFAGLSAIGLVPIVGDGTKTTAKVGKFILKNVDNVPRIAKVLTVSNTICPQFLKVLAKNEDFVNAIKQISSNRSLKITKKEAERINKALETAGLSEYAIRIARNSNIDEYLVEIIDAFGNINIDKMHKIRLAIQKGTFSSEDISSISKRMSELGITKEYEAVMKKIDFGTYLKNIVGNPPSDMLNPHAHHILFKTGNGAAQQALVEEGQAILRKYGIDPIVGPENLVWAPNAVSGQHNISALEKVVNGLKEIDEMGGDYDDILNFLENMGQIASSRG